MIQSEKGEEGETKEGETKEGENEKDKKEKEKEKKEEEKKLERPPIGVVMKYATFAFSFLSKNNLAHANN